MKHAHKYMLVPVEPESKPVQLKETLRTVLKSGQKDHKTAKKYSHLLRNYVHYKKKPERKQLDFLKHIPAIYHNKVNILLKDAHLSWSPLGELKTPYGQVIHGSNMVDLLKEALIGKKKHSVHGWDSFIQQIASSSIPLNFLFKSNYKARH